MDLRATYNKIARDWFRDHQHDTWWIEGTDKFASLILKGGTILDVGCGAGVKSEYLANKGLSVVGIDLSDEMITIAKENLPGIRFSQYDIKEPVRLGEKFDGVFAQAVLLHIPKAEIKKVINNIILELNSGGYLYVAVKELGSDGVEEKRVKENDYGYDYERFFSYYALDELRRYIGDAGLKIVWEKIVSSGKTNWLQVIAQK